MPTIHCPVCDGCPACNLDCCNDCSGDVDDEGGEQYCGCRGHICGPPCASDEFDSSEFEDVS